MKYCHECQECIQDYYTISNNVYCLSCIDRYMLVKCPGDLCFNVISLNGYEIEDTEDNTCTMCKTIFCDFCLVRAKNIRMCRDCFNS